jgi:uncharacterized protein YaeQ
MANPATLYRFRIDLSDVDRNVYETLDFRVAMHPSESLPFLMTRVLAFALNIREGLEFNPAGLSDSDEPCLRALSLTGVCELWIEIGNPSARKLHRAAKAAAMVKVYTYKDPIAMLRELQSTPIHRSSEIELFSFEMAFLKSLGETLKRDNSWGLLLNDGVLSVTPQNQETVATQIHVHKI